MRRLRLIIPLLLLCLLLLFALGKMGDGSSPSLSPELGQAPWLLVDESFAGAFTIVPAGAREGGLSVNPLEKQNAWAFFYAYYRPCENISTGWTGNHATCNEGSTSEAFQAAVLQRINYFRAMAGVPADITFRAELNEKAQKAALMLSANGLLSHTPDESWRCYSLEGAQGARSSNLYLVAHSCEAIDGYMQDAGSGNAHVPHRRWLLNPRTMTMGIGDIPPVSGYPAANALLVFGIASAERPKTRDNFFAWPPPGYVPYVVVYPRWSFSYDDADFSQASVSMTYEGSEVPLTLLPVADGYGENTLVWEPHISLERPSKDQWYTVRVRNVVIGGVVHHFTYVVILFDPY
nr:CAP domain-containing protein [Chloroflexota bacterium]